MKVEIWSDIRCPFCYIGKRKFEAALNQFKHKDEVEVEWKSFQLDPGLKHEPGKTIYSYLAERKGMSVDSSRQMHLQMAEAAKEVGLEFNFDKTIVAGSFDAERLIQFAKAKGKGAEAEERMFKAYFTEGKNIGDFNVLAELAVELGFEKNEALQMLNSDAFVKEVNDDIQRASELGVRGVPFFVIDKKYAVSGAQATEMFAGALAQAWNFLQKASDNPLNEVSEGDSCSVDKKC